MAKSVTILDNVVWSAVSADAVAARAKDALATARAARDRIVSAASPKDALIAWADVHGQVRCSPSSSPYFAAWDAGEGGGRGEARDARARIERSNAVRVANDRALRFA